MNEQMLLLKIFFAQTKSTSFENSFINGAENDLTFKRTFALTLVPNKKCRFGVYAVNRLPLSLSVSFCPTQSLDHSRFRCLHFFPLLLFEFGIYSHVVLYTKAYLANFNTFIAHRFSRCVIACVNVYFLHLVQC